MDIIITGHTDSAEATWGDLLDAIARCTPINTDLPLSGEWSGDVDAYAGGFRIRVIVH